MKTQVDVQTLLGFFSATGLPLVIHTVLTFLHPALYTLACGQEYVDGVASCYHDSVVEAILFLVFSAAAVAYGVVTLRSRLASNPTPLHTTTIPTADGGTVEMKTVAAPMPQNGVHP